MTVDYFFWQFVTEQQLHKDSNTVIDERAYFDWFDKRVKKNKKEGGLNKSLCHSLSFKKWLTSLRCACKHQMSDCT